MADPPAGPQSSAELMSIAELSPSIHSTKSIKAVVALIWPYSASNKSLTLLLVEPDFRLRRNKGQVKAEFHGSSAKEVARSGLGSGDEVLLSLEGVNWTRDDADMRTPGKGVEWKLSFAERVLMQVHYRLLQQGLHVCRRANLWSLRSTATRISSLS